MVHSFYTELESECALSEPEWVQHVEKGWVHGCLLVVRAAATCTSLRRALLGPQGMHVGRFAYLHGWYASLEPQLAQPQGARGLASVPAGRTLAQRSMAFNEFVTREAGSAAKNACVRGGSWDLIGLRASLSSLTELDNLTLTEIDSSTEAAIMSAALASCTVRHIEYFGRQPLAFPVSVRRLYLVCPSGNAAECRALFACLAPLTQLDKLVLVLKNLRLTSADFQCLADWLPQLQELEIVVDASLGTHELAALSKLSPSVQVSVLMISGSAGLGSHLELLRSVPLYCLGLDSSSAEFTAADEALLAQCSVACELTLFLVDPSMRLQHLPQVPRVVYEASVIG